MSPVASNPCPIFVINLDRSTDRLAVMAEQCRRAGLSFERFPAVDGLRLSAEQIASVQHPVWPTLLNGRRLSPGEVGCALSHQAVIRCIVERRLPYALIMEDDCEFDPERLLQVLGSVDRLPAGWDVVTFCYLRNQRPYPVAALTDDLSVAAFLNKVCSAVCYLVSARGARKLSAQGRLAVIADYWPWLVNRCRLDMYGIWEPVARQRPAVRSAIDDVDRTTTGLCQRSVRPPATKLLRKTTRWIITSACLVANHGRLAAAYRETVPPVWKRWRLKRYGSKAYNATASTPAIRQ